MNREDRKLCRKIWKAATKETRRSADEFHPHYVSINCIAEKVEHPEYAEQVKNRLWRELESHMEEYGDYVMFSFAHPNDLGLTWEGITAFMDILAAYFDPEALSATAKYMRQLDELDKSDMRIKRLERERRQLMEQAPTTMLKKLVEEYRASGTMGGTKMDDETCSLIEAELQSRGPLHFLKQRKGIRMQLLNDLQEDCII